MQRTYLAIDLKSYYASAECASRHLDPLTTNLVVADSSRTEKTTCLAVSPSLKAYGIPGRARLFEVVQKVKEVNANRLREAVRLRKAVYKDGKPSFSSASYDSLSLAADPSLELSYLVAPPRMAYYEKVSRQIYGIYLKYIAPEDIVVYSIDEVFIDATSYLSHYNMTAHDLAMTMIREVLYTTGITATAGIGTNLYLAKLAMDITAKADPSKVSMAKYSMLPARNRHIIIPVCRCPIVLKSSLRLPPCEAMRMRLLLKAEIISKEIESSCLKNASKL